MHCVSRFTFSIELKVYSRNVPSLDLHWKVAFIIALYKVISYVTDIVWIEATYTEEKIFRNVFHFMKYIEGTLRLKVLLGF